MTQHFLERHEIVSRGGKGQDFRAAVPCGRTLREHRQPQEPDDREFRKRQHEPQVSRLQRRQFDKSPGPGGRVAHQTQEPQFAADLQQGATAVLLPASECSFR